MIIHKLHATLWKCMKIRQRHYMLTIFVFSIPILLFGLLAWARTKIGHIGKQYVNESTYVDPMSEDMLYERYKVDIPNTYLLYAPATQFTDELMRRVQLKMDIHNENFFAFQSDDDLLIFYNKNVTEHTVYAVVFDGLANLADEDEPNTLNYSIRNYEKHLDWQTNLRYNTIMNNYIPESGSEKYFLKAFVNLQLAIDKTYLSMKNPKDLDVSFSMQEFPYPPHYNDMGLNELFSTLLPFVTLFSTIFIFPGTLKRMMEEKQTGIKELLKMMGLPPSIMYLSWFVDAMFPVLFSSIVCTVFMKVTWGTDYPPIEYCNGIIFGVFLLLYFSSCIAFCLFVGTVSDSPSITTTFGILIWIITYILPFSWKNIGNFGCGLNMVVSLIPNVAMYNGFHAISLYEIQGIGVQWGNIFTTANGSGNGMSLGHALVMLFVDIILLLVVGFYLDQVRPGTYGLPKPWNYPITNLMNCFKKVKSNIKRKSSVGIIDYDDNVKVEECTKVPGILIHKLTKKYGDKLAVSEMSVKFYNGEIAVLLGKNGAGKTTTMSVLTGMIHATEGDVLINGYDIGDNLDYVRSIIGICPQHDLLFSELTVFEHILFFAKLHNISSPVVKVRQLLQQLGIYEQRDKLPCKISGGMKRKLCLGMAIISNPKVLIMDEPTSGLDPKSRRDIWDLIKDWRSKNPNTTILVSTHFMEEADVLGDRITIMEKGKLIAQGSPMYLKREYGNECVLTLIMNPAADTSLRDSVSAMCPGVRIKQTDNIYTLTLDQDRTNLIELLELIGENDAVQHIGISISSIEEVFLKLANVKVATVDTFEQRPLVNSNTEATESTSYEEWTSVQRYGGLRYQFMRYLPYLLMACAMIILLTQVGSTQSVGNVSRPELKLQLNAYGKTKVFFSVDSQLSNTAVAREFKKLIQDQGSQAIQVDSVSNDLIALGLSNLEEYKQRAVVAIEFNATANGNQLVNMMYSNVALHGAPIILNLATSAIARSLGGLGINTANTPLQTNEDVAIDELASEVQIVILWVILAPIALLFLVSSYVNYPLIERVSNFKHLIYMSGVSPALYWLKMFLFHFFALYLPSVVILLLIIFPNPMYYHGAGALLLMFICYGIMMIPFVFVFSYKKSVAAAVGSLSILTIFTGLVLTFIIVVLRNCGDTFYERLGLFLHVVSHASPQYWLTNVLITFSKKSVWQYKWEHMQPAVRDISCKYNLNPCCPVNGVVDTNSCQEYKSFFVDGLSPGYLLLATISCFLFYGLILCLLDSLKFKRFIHCLKKVTFSKYKKLTNDVETGTQTTIATNNVEAPPFSAKHLKMVFAAKEAVKDLSFSVKAGQCYGLLGVNGAGKTTTFNMLTGSEIPTSGNATIKRRSTELCSLNNDWESYFKEIGYCPQFNAINEVLSARVVLRLFGLYRGVPKSKLDNEVEKVINKLALSDFADIPCGNLSGGNKRKLCLGISLIGKPPVVFLDEPTTGVDPVSRRKIWDVLKELKEDQQALVLTSHSMDECEILCDELAIMKKGEVYMEGNINELKLRHGQGLTIKIKLKEPNLYADTVDSTALAIYPNIQEKMQNDFPGRIEEKDIHEGLLHYFLPSPKNESANPKSFCTKDLIKFLIFMEELKSGNSNVLDYTINTSTLEDIFLMVARQSEDET